MENWHVVEDSFDPQAQHHKETVFTIGNGYLGARGAFEEGYPGARPLILVHGLFDDVPVVHTELVNVPYVLDFTVWIDGERFRMDHGTVLAYQRDLNLRNGVLTRSVRWRSEAGHTLDLVFARFASLADGHVLALRCQVTPVDFAGELAFRAGLPGYVENDGVLHWSEVGQGPAGEQGAWLEVATRHSHRHLGAAMHLDVRGAAVSYTYQGCTMNPTLVARCAVEPGQSLVAEKVVTLYTDRDVSAPAMAARDALRAVAAQGYVALLAASAEAWADDWAVSDVVIEGDDAADLALRFSLYQLLIAAPRWDDRDSIPAKTLSGLGYRGHVFWDAEIFMLPFFTYTQPELARNMLRYRYHTLPGARRKAAEQGFEGAMYAWESAATGDETTPRWVPIYGGELVRIWCGDIELHITADVAYATHRYWRVTGDDAFMLECGAEIVLETARFWGSRVEWDAARGVYEISDVIGPDENHEHVDNNAYTNAMARANLEIALEVWDWLSAAHPARAQELARALELTPEHRAHWRDVAEALWLGRDPETGLIAQFDGFFELKDVDFAAYEPRTTSMQALLGVEETQAYQVLKQPDVLMLLYLLDERDPRVLRANWDYYTPRTDHAYGSSLGPAIQAAMAVRMDEREMAYQHFMRAARTDLDNARGNTAEGIHGATAGGLWQAVIFGFAGIRVGGGAPVAHPRLPSRWKRLTFNLIYRGQLRTYDISAT